MFAIKLFPSQAGPLGEREQDEVPRQLSTFSCSCFNSIISRAPLRGAAESTSGGGRFLYKLARSAELKIVTQQWHLEIVFPAGSRTNEGARKLQRIQIGQIEPVRPTWRPT